MKACPPGATAKATAKAPPGATAKAPAPPPPKEEDNACSRPSPLPATAKTSPPGPAAPEQEVEAQNERAGATQWRRPSDVMASFPGTSRNWVAGEWVGAFKPGSAREQYAAQRGGWRKPRGGQSKAFFESKYHQDMPYHSWYSRQYQWNDP